MTLRPYQVAAVEAMRSAAGAGSRAILLVQPTGTGKTRTLTEAVRGHVSRGGRPLWVAHRRELLSQAEDALRGGGLTPERDVWVRSIQELRVSGGPPATMLVVDEAHHLPSSDWSQLRTEQYPDALLLGATATPERGDGRGLGALFDALVVGITVREAMAQGWLVPAEIVGPDRALDPGQLAQDPVDAYLEHAAGTQAILFASSVELAQEYAARFTAQGVPSAAVFGAMTGRASVLEAYAAGTVRVLTSVAVLTEGFDCPATETVILARGFGTTGGYLQAVGRGLRLSPGKSRCLVLDLRGCAHLHGGPDEERTYSLDGRGIRRAADEIDVRFCPVCGAPVVGEACEQCGHAGEMRARPPRVLGLPMTRFAGLRREDDEARCRRLSRWLAHARARGWREGWCHHRYKAVYGEPIPRQILLRARGMR